MTARIFVSFHAPEHDASLTVDTVPRKGEFITFFDHPGEFVVTKVTHKVLPDRQVPEIHIHLEKV